MKYYFLFTKNIVKNTSLSCLSDRFASQTKTIWMNLHCCKFIHIGYTLFCLPGVVFMVLKSIALKHTPTYQMAILTIISPCVFHWTKCSTWYSSVYMLQLSRQNQRKKEFYTDLHIPLSTIPATNEVLILADLNAKVSWDANSWREVVEKYW